MTHKIAVIGAGWYGCHLSATLVALGFDVSIFERNDDVLSEASGNNQFRLHLGFHYARHHRTRIQSRDGFLRFTDRYPDFSRPVDENLYAVASAKSLIDYATYRIIMTSTGVDLRETHSASIPVTNVDGMVLTDERVLVNERARAYFRARLGERIRFGVEVGDVRQDATGVYLDGEQFDYAIDCTWGHLIKPSQPCIYEPTLLLYYRLKTPGSTFPAFTLVDGPLCSIYPTEDPEVFTLSSVPFTPLGRFSTAEEAVAVRNGVDKNLVFGKQAQMEAQIAEYVPDFEDMFEFADIQRAIKTKPQGASDDRSCSVSKEGRIISVMSGKIDTIFTASERVLGLLERDISDFGTIRSTAMGY